MGTGQASPKPDSTIAAIAARAGGGPANILRVIFTGPEIHNYLGRDTAPIDQSLGVAIAAGARLTNNDDAPTFGNLGILLVNPLNHFILHVQARISFPDGSVWVNLAADLDVPLGEGLDVVTLDENTAGVTASNAGSGLTLADGMVTIDTTGGGANIDVNIFAAAQ